MTEKEFTEVTVKEAAHEDAGRGIARLSVDVMKKLGLVSGDVIEIHGKKMKFMQVTAEHLADRTLRLIEKDRFLIFQNRLDWLLYLGSRLLPKRLQSRMLCREFSKEVRAKRA